MGASGRQQRTADITGYTARGAARAEDVEHAAALAACTGARSVTVTEYRGDVEVSSVTVEQGESRDQFEIYVAKNGAVGIRDNVTGGYARWFMGEDALMDATSWCGRLNRGEIPGPSRVQEHDLVVIHTGSRRYEVLRVELDSFRDGERCDYALLAPVEHDDLRDPFWQACDLLHVIESRTGLTGSLQLPEVKVFHH